ncbi:MAG: response regulator [Planctomycetota bacterium]|jgi:CheY-like chemotaxis protein
MPKLEVGIDGVLESQEGLGLVGVKVLIVEDVKSIRAMLVNSLTSLKCNATGVANGKAAMAELVLAAKEGAPYDVVVSDLAMPVMDGVTLLRQIRGIPLLKSTPFVIHTTYSERDQVVECARLGISCYIVKPSKTERLVEAILQAVEQRPGGSFSKTNDALCGLDLEPLRKALLNAATLAIASGESTLSDPKECSVYKAAMEYFS